MDIHKPTTVRAAVAPPVPYVRDMFGISVVETEMMVKVAGWSFVVMESLAEAGAMMHAEQAAAR